MEVRRVRRFGRRNTPTHTLLPLHLTHLSNTISCWYCDFKSSALNQPLFRFGRKHARFLKVWFSVGVGFSLAALFGVTMVLVWELAVAMRFYKGDAKIDTFLCGSLFGVSPPVFGLRISFADIGYICISTVISVCIHEVGHAIAAASEGIQMEYTAVFLAIVFPGALVAFNHELLQAIPHMAALRIYCAGIWHNAAFCVVCALALFLLPSILYPFYIHGESPMVLGVSSRSPLSGYLSPSDLIVSLDGTHIYTAEEWMKMTSLMAMQHPKNYSNFNGFDGKKGYCVPSSLIEESKLIQLVDNQATCPNDLIAFATTSCLDSITSNDIGSELNNQNEKEDIHCLTAKDIVTRKKCGDGWAKTPTNESSCQCSEEESCLTPVLTRGLIWVEITYSSPYSPECGDKSSNVEEMHCGGTFVFIGDMVSMAHSVWLTSYKPRWSFGFSAYLPNGLEKLLMCTFHVSLTLALLNSLPVYFLDGESILEAILHLFSFVSPRKRGTVLQSCLLGGTLISVIVFVRTFFIVIL